MLLLKGDFNERTANVGGSIGTREGKKEAIRRSKNKMLNREGKVLLNNLRDRGWTILWKF